MKERKTGAYTYNDKAYNFNFATELSAHDKTVFVRTVVDTLVSEDSYDSIIRDMIFDFSVVMLFTDIDTSFTKKVNDNETSSLDIIEQFLTETNVADIVKANIDDELINELNNAIDKSIAYRTGIQVNPLNDALSSLFYTIEKKISELDVDSMMGMANVLGGLVGDVTIDDIVNAYMSSDIHKKNLVEIEQVRKHKAEFAKDMDNAITSVNNDETLN